MAGGDSIFEREVEAALAKSSKASDGNLLNNQREDFDWREQFRKDFISFAEKKFDNMGDKFLVDSFVRDNIDRATDYLSSFVNVDEMGQPITGVRRLSAMSAAEYSRLWNVGVNWFSGQLGFDFNAPLPRSGGGGSRGPSAADIRNSFDEDQLTETVNKMWGAYLITDNKNSRSIAKSYIEAMVATKGEKAIDLQTYILGKIRADSRHKMLYQNKPSGVDELQYITPYIQATQQVVGGQGGSKAAVGDIAGGGAALGATAAQFNERLARTSQNQQTKGYINSIEERVRGVKNVLRG